ncbi:hypothetical protein J6590_039612 [Homalodisca vitripennis]|nr:hypothetical protein J6590_039612 [Homalodisca vitripennis]
MVIHLSVVVGVLSVSVLVLCNDSDSLATSSTKSSSKRGLLGLTGVPGVLYSPQFSGPPVHTVPVPHPVPVPVPHPVPVQVPRPFPVTVHKPVGLPVPVGVPVPVNVPVPKPYPVPVPVNIPHGPSPLHAFGGGPFGTHPTGFDGGFSHAALGSYSGKLGYGLGVYSHPGAPSLPLAHPGLAAELALASSYSPAGLPLPPHGVDHLKY